MDMVTFKAGRAEVAINVLNILLTQKFENDCTAVPKNDPALLGVKEFMGQPVPVFDTSLLLDQRCTTEVNAELIQILHDRERDHEDWLAALNSALENNTPFTKPRDPSQCAFGKWYDSFESENGDLMRILASFDRPHTRIHSLADSLLNQAAEGDLKGALDTLQYERKTTFDHLKKLFKTARDEITQSYKPIVVYTTVDGHSPHIGFLFDSVEDSITVSEQHILPLSQKKSLVTAQSERSRALCSNIVALEDRQLLQLSVENFENAYESVMA